MRNLLSTFILSLALVLAGAAFAGSVNINTADAKMLAKELVGVGPAKAKLIVEYREKNGPFKTADDLKRVQGIGAATVERNRSRIVIEAAPAPKTSPTGN